MSEESYSVEQKESNHPSVELWEIGNDQPQGSAIERLYEKLHQAQSVEAANSPSENEQCTRANAPMESSLINRLFEKVTQTRLEALPAPAAPITRITHTEIKAMKAVTTTAESKPEVVVRKQCANSVNSFWSDLTFFLGSLSASKSKSSEASARNSEAHRK
jgi:beta-galactosidase/beta-glucuronidase